MKTITFEQMKAYEFIKQIEKNNRFRRIAVEKYQVQKYATNVDMTTFIKNINLAIYKKWCV
ncbi:hypothetical protein [Bacillus thuringiensis]|uniref:hypothetical protein n=1 Tax=Bacillus thuringiensis TaxID=1428 RepID=UPI002AB3E721|nr:hypothetical protein [Bacillus thuringiensis]MDY7965503.1 hypothetical protein [Bacillus thuringiensis]